MAEQAGILCQNDGPFKPWPFTWVMLLTPMRKAGEIPGKRKLDPQKASEMDVLCLIIAIAIAVT